MLVLVVCSGSMRSMRSMRGGAQKAKDKWNEHGHNYDVIGYAFAPCIMTTT
jgi:hypothetical protein